jgi:hypothetical protein
MTNDWGPEYLSAAKVYDFAQDPDDYKVSRQSKVTVGGVLLPVTEEDRELLGEVFCDQEAAISHYQGRVTFKKTGHPFTGLTATMQAMLKRAAHRTKETPDFKHISIDPRDYTIFTTPHVPIPVVSIHTRPERCWFLGILKFEGALGLSLGRMRVMRPTDKGVYPVTIRTKWRALTNKTKQEEVRDAYRRLINPTR